jgi:hypothetical protein
MNSKISTQWKETFIYGVLLILFILFILFTQKRDYSNLNKYGEEAIGVIVKFGSKNSVHWTYKVKNKSIKIIDRNDRFSGLQIGEKYLITYDSTYLSNAIIHYDKPIIDFSSDTIYDYRLINPIHEDNVYVSFSYEYNGEKTTRQQVLPSNQNWTEINNFKVILDINNSRIAYLEPAGTPPAED